MIPTSQRPSGTPRASAPGARLRSSFARVRGDRLPSGRTRSGRRGPRPIISYEEYHPYGSTSWWATKSGVQVSAKRYRYTGKEKDEETGLGYHGARFYAPWLGRWASADPAGMVDGPNRYAYCRGNPVGGRDPTGLRTMEGDWSAPRQDGGESSWYQHRSVWDNDSGEVSIEKRTLETTKRGDLAAQFRGRTLKINPGDIREGRHGTELRLGGGMWASWEGHVATGKGTWATPDAYSKDRVSALPGTNDARHNIAAWSMAGSAGAGLWGAVLGLLGFKATGDVRAGATLAAVGDVLSAGSLGSVAGIKATKSAARRGFAEVHEGDGGGPVSDLLFGARPGQGLPGSQGVEISRRPSISEMENLTTKHGVEFGVTYTLGPGRGGGGGQYRLHSALPSSPTRMILPIGSDIMQIFHTHPTLPYSSPADRRMLSLSAELGSPQRISSVIPVGTGTLIPFDQYRTLR